MNKVQVKQIIKRVRTSFVLVIVAAVLSQVFNIAQYAYTRSSIKRQTSEKAYRDLREIQRIVNLKTNVETAVQNAYQFARTRQILWNSFTTCFTQ